MAVGWGQTVPGDSGSSPNRLQKISVPIYTRRECRRILDDLRDEGKKPQPPGIYESILCAGQENQAPAHGDSGGPLLVQTPDGWAQVGVLSQATQNPDQTVVYMGQYTRTSFLYDWIYPSDAEAPPETPKPFHLHFAHFGSGGGMATDLLLLNPQSGFETKAVVEVFRSNGTLRVRHDIYVPSAGLVEWELPGGERLETGSVVVESKTRLSGILRFRYGDGGSTAVSATPIGEQIVVPISSRPERIGVAVRNGGIESVTIRLSWGSQYTTRRIPARGQVAQFVDEYFPYRTRREVPETLFIKTEPPGGEISVLALEFVGDSLVTLPAPVLSEGDLKEGMP